MTTTNVEARLRRLARWCRQSHRARLLALTACALAVPAVFTNPLALDDLLLREQYEAGGIAAMYRFVPLDPAQTALGRAAGELPWWAADGLQVEFWRPIAALLFGLEQRLVPELTDGFCRAVARAVGRDV